MQKWLKLYGITLIGTPVNYTGWFSWSPDICLWITKGNVTGNCLPPHHLPTESKPKRHKTKDFFTPSFP
jgi:hypothetical protein